MDTIVFFLALIISLFGVSLIIVAIINDKFTDNTGTMFYIMLVISLLWTCFYWLVN